MRRLTLFCIGGLVFAVVGYPAFYITGYLVDDFRAHQVGPLPLPLKPQDIVHLSTYGDVSVYEFTHPETKKRYLIVFSNRGSLSVTVE